MGAATTGVRTERGGQLRREEVLAHARRVLEGLGGPLLDPLPGLGGNARREVPPLLCSPAITATPITVASAINPRDLRGGAYA